MPLQWARTQNNLGTALLDARRTRERHRGCSSRPSTPIATRCKEWTRERVPLDWAMTQNNLGTALRTLGERESGTARLEQAVNAFRDALQGMDARARAARLGEDAEQPRQRASDARGTRERHRAAGAGRQRLPRRAARNAPASVCRSNGRRRRTTSAARLRRSGERESGTARLEQAIRRLPRRAQEYTRERVPLQWAMTQNNLGNALATLGARESGTARLFEAINAYRNALKEWTRERVHSTGP